MIVELTIENFKSCLHKTTVNFAAGTTSKLSGNLLRLRNGERVVKSMAIYGPNASGKTTIMDGLYALKSFVLFSSKDQTPTSPILHFESFALDKSSSTMPSRVEIVIDLSGDRYTLDVSATSDRVWNETLTVRRISSQPSRKNSPKVLIQRSWDPDRLDYNTHLHEDVGSKLTIRAVLEQTTPNRLMLGKLGSVNSEIARQIIEWFDKDLWFYDMHRNPGSELASLTDSAQLLKENVDFAATVMRFIKDADTGIEDFQVTDETYMKPIFSESEKKLEFKETTRPGLSFRHTTEDRSEVFLRQHQESSGTLRFVALLAAILRPSLRRRLVCIDEISASMHPDLVRRMILIIHSSKYNRLGSQVLFTTHDTHLMDPGELLRRDQITICKKNRYGHSSACRLDGFQDSARSDANLQRQYLQGRFGGVPQFGPTLEDVPVDDAPLEVGS